MVSPGHSLILVKKFAVKILMTRYEAELTAAARLVQEAMQLYTKILLASFAS